MTTTYRNPWHKPGKSEYGPPFYATEVKPVEHNGHLIYQRIHGVCWDIVRDGVCRAQYAGLRGAKEAIDTRADLRGVEKEAVTV